MKKAIKLLATAVLTFLLASVMLGNIGVFIDGYSLDAVDQLNLLYERNHKVSEVDRVVYIKAVIDQSYIDFCAKERDYGLFCNNGSFSFTKSWTAEEQVERIISRVSKSFEYQFGIKLILVDIEKWNPHSEDSASLIQELQKEVPLNGYDMVIGFSGRLSDFNCRAYMPEEGHLGNYAIVGLVLPQQINWLSFIFINSYHLQCYTTTHEMGHIFGAIHPEEVYGFPFSVMNFLTGYFTTHFDKYNKEIILHNKYLPFK